MREVKLYTAHPYWCVWAVDLRTEQNWLPYLSLGGGHPLVALVLRLARRLLHPDDDGDSRVGEEKHEERQKILQHHDHQAVKNTMNNWVKLFRNRVNFTPALTMTVVMRAGPSCPNRNRKLKTAERGQKTVVDGNHTGVSGRIKHQNCWEVEVQGQGCVGIQWRGLSCSTCWHCLAFFNTKELSNWRGTKLLRGQGQRFLNLKQL